MTLSFKRTKKEQKAVLRRYPGHIALGTSGLDGRSEELFGDYIMSKLQVSENSLTDIANTTLANQLESRLKELERNIAVARQFIGMADECYSKVKHEWELLQQDIGVKNAATNQTRYLPSTEERTDEPEIKDTPRREKRGKSESQRKKDENSPDISPGPEDHAEFAKNGKSSRKQSETFSQDFKHGKKSKASLKKTQ